MRPASIIMFERLFLASLALGVVIFLAGYEAMMDQLGREPAVVQLGIGGGFMIGLMVVSVAINLLLWFLIARKASTVAKWILVVLTVIGVGGFLASLATTPMTWDLATLLSVLSYLLEVAAVVFLFRADAMAWFKGEWTTDPATFD